MFSRARIVQKAGFIGGFTFLHAVIQCLNAAAGIILVRSMTKENYAWFTIFNSIAGTVSVLSDSGLGSALNSLGGPLCDNKPRFAALLASIRRWRLVFVSVSLLVSLPVGAYLLHVNHASWSTLGGVLLVIAAGAVPSAEISMLSAAIRLHTRLRGVLIAEATASITRLVVVVGAAAFGAVAAVVAAASTVLAQCAQVARLRRDARDLLQEGQRMDDEFRRPVMSMVRGMMPLCLFQCVQVQVTTWILSIAGTTTAVAEIGALARLGVIMTFLAVPTTNIIFPMIARVSDKARLAALCGMTIISALAVALGLVGAGVFLWKPVLWILGSQYEHLRVELVWYMGFLGVSFLSSVFMGLVLTRGWVRHSWLHIPATLLAQIAGILWLDISNVTGAVQFGALGCLASLGVGIWQVWKGFENMNDVSRRQSAPI